MNKIVRGINTSNEYLGKAVAWLVFGLVLLQFAVVLLRYGFDWGSIALQESITYLHALIFLLGAAYTLKHDDHVRVDIFYQKMSLRGRAWVNFLGALLLLMPVSIFIFYICWEYVISAWQIKEASAQAGGIAYLYMLKAMLLVMPVLLFLQGIAQAMNAWLELVNRNTSVGAA